MANLYDTSALKSFNEKDYINKMYDSYADSQKKLLEKNYIERVQILEAVLWGK